ncbi:iron chelate uptake ABC transporter family permease subunit [Phytoactinopolyspora halotolerans]|uniref:Iron chelate uptake ABC transporter family permease subunit n=1 Tax=Phytoactinopolyspora halotolerans TaxID=1981512 RepID=A0A6L9S8T1_9ACTN|nr:iron chelate uptake ABC transporter family permease subunit [Phytoactinopolyspora halotolerans]
MLVLLLVTVVLSIGVGANPISPRAVLDTIAGGGDDESQYVVWQQRVPRTVIGTVVGTALGVAGALIQAFTRNPLADPGILGVNSGAAFAVAVGIVFFGVTGISGYVWFACAGALIVTLAVYAIGAAGRGGTDPIRLTLAGVAVGAVLSGATTGLTLTHPDAFDRMRGWNAGSLLERGFDVLTPVVPLLVIGLTMAIAVSSAMNSVALGDDMARAHGVNVGRTRVLVLIAVTLLAGSATAIAGPIAFVGLMVPHVVRWTVGPDQRRIVVGSLLLSPIVVLLSDVLGRVLVLPSEMPVGIVTAFVGAPVLVVLVRRRTASAL